MAPVILREQKKRDFCKEHSLRFLRSNFVRVQHLPAVQLLDQWDQVNQGLATFGC